MGQGSCQRVYKVKSCKSSTAVNESEKNTALEAEKKFHSRLFYNSAVSPTTVDSLLAKKYCVKKAAKQTQRKFVNTRVFQRIPGTGSYWEKCERGQQKITPSNVKGVEILNNSVNMCHSNESADKPPGLDNNVVENNSKFTCRVSENAESSNVSVQPKVFDSSVQTCVETNGGVSDSFILLYDVNFVGIEDKFASSIMYSSKNHADYVNQPIYQRWLDQSDFKFGYVPLQD